MKYLEKINPIPNQPGIYIFFDVNDVALYVGTTKKLQSRIKTHFTNLTNVNPLEINRIQYWTWNDITPKERVLLEKAFVNKLQPKFNLSKEDIRAKNEEMNVKLPSEKESFEIFFDLPEQSRLDLLVRIKNKAHFILDLSRQFEMLGITTKGKRLLVKQCQDLINLSNEI